MYHYKCVDSPIEMDELFKLRYQVYCQEKSWIDPNKFPDGKERDAYDPYAIHYAAIDRYGDIVATMRAIRKDRLPSHLNLPILKHPSIQNNTFPTNNCTEASRLVVKKNHRTFKSALILIDQFYEDAKQDGLDFLFITVEYPMIVLLKRYGYWFDILGEPGDYMGKTIPAILDLKKNEVYRNKKRRTTRTKVNDTSETLLTT